MRALDSITNKNHDTQKVKIGVLYPSDLPDSADETAKNQRKIEQRYGETFGDPNNKPRRELEKEFNCEFVPIDYHCDEVENIIKANTDTHKIKKKLTTWLTKFYTENAISGFIIPGSDFNIISPGKNLDNQNRSYMEEAVFKVEKSSGMPYLHICGGEQSFCWSKIKDSIRAEVKMKFKIDRKESDEKFISNQFQEIFREPYEARYENLLGYFKRSHDMRFLLGETKDIFNAKSIKETLEFAKKEVNKDYVGDYFEGYFTKCLDEISLCPTKQAKDEKFRQYFEQGDRKHFSQYYSKKPPAMYSRQSVDQPKKSDEFDYKLFEKYYAAYGETNGIIIVNNSLQYTGKNHNQSFYSIATDIPVSFVDDNRWQSRYKESFMGKEAGYTASEHNQSLVYNKFVKDRLASPVAGIAVTATYGTPDIGMIVKAAEKMSGNIGISTQTHPEVVVLEKGKNHTDPRIAGAAEAANNLLSSFFAAAKEYLHKGKQGDKSATEGKWVNKVVPSLLAKKNPEVRGF